jgi:hypothetical protein
VAARVRCGFRACQRATFCRRSRGSLNGYGSATLITIGASYQSRNSCDETKGRMQ